MTENQHPWQEENSPPDESVVPRQPEEDHVSGSPSAAGFEDMEGAQSATPSAGAEEPKVDLQSALDEDAPADAAEPQMPPDAGTPPMGEARPQFQGPPAGPPPPYPYYGTAPGGGYEQIPPQPPPYGAVPPNQWQRPPYGYGYTPPYGVQAPGPVAPPPAAAQTVLHPPKGGGNAWKIVVAIVGGLLAVLLLGFAAVGIYYLADARSNETPRFGSSSNTEPFNRFPGGNEDGGNDFGGLLPGTNQNSVRLGISCITVDQTMASQSGLPQGLMILSFEDDSSLPDQGAQVLDIITKADGKQVQSISGLSAILQNYQAGDSLKLTLYRPSKSGGEGEEIEVTVTLLASQTTQDQSGTGNWPGNPTFPDS